MFRAKKNTPRNSQSSQIEEKACQEVGGDAWWIGQDQRYGCNIDCWLHGDTYKDDWFQVVAEVFNRKHPTLSWYVSTLWMASRRWSPKMVRSNLTVFEICHVARSWLFSFQTINYFYAASQSALIFNGSTTWALDHLGHHTSQTAGIKDLISLQAPAANNEVVGLSN